MATSTFYIPSSSGWEDNGTQGSAAKLRLKVVREYDAATNQSTLTITPQSYCTSWGLKFMLLANALLTLNGSTVYSGGGSSSEATNLSVTYDTTTTWADVKNETTGDSVAWTATVNHDATGNATFSFAVDFRFYRVSSPVYTTFYGKTGSKTVNEPRASTLSASDGTFGSSVSITISRASSSYKHTIKVSCAGRNTTIVSKTSNTTVTWTPSVATYAPLMPNAMSAVATLTCLTYSGDTLIGTTSIEITMTLPASSVKPTVAISVSDPQGYATTYGGYVAGKSKATVTVTPTLKYSATQKSLSIQANGQTFSSSPATTDVLSADATTIKAKVVDSRNQSSGWTSTTITVLAYAAPKIVSFGVIRCNSDGTSNPSGAFFKASYSVEITALNNHNSKALSIKYKKRTASSYTTSSITISSYTASGTKVIAADTDSIYDVQLVVTDDFGTTSLGRTLSTAYTYLNFGNGRDAGLGIGMVNTENKAVQMDGGWKLKIGDTQIDAVFFKQQNTRYPSLYCPCFGHVFADRKELHLYVLIPRFVPDTWTITLNSVKSYAVNQEGLYLGGSTGAELSSYITDIGNARHYLHITMVNSSGWNVAAKSVICGRLLLSVVFGDTT